MKIEEIMTRAVRSLEPRMPAAEAVRKLLAEKISGLPVVDSAGRLVGMFTEKDVLRVLLPSYVTSVGKFVYENNPKTILGKVCKFSECRVEQLMQKDIVTLAPQTPVSEAAHLMLTRNVRRVPVVDAKGKMVGIVARSDVLENLLKK